MDGILAVFPALLPKLLQQAWDCLPQDCLYNSLWLGPWNGQVQSLGKTQWGDFQTTH